MSQKIIMPQLKKKERRWEKGGVAKSNVEVTPFSFPAKSVKFERDIFTGLKGLPYQEMDHQFCKSIFERKLGKPGPGLNIPSLYISHKRRLNVNVCFNGR